MLELGKGAFGSVFKVEKYGFTYALKECELERSDDGSRLDWNQMVACFREEDIGRMQHPFIINIIWTRWMPDKFQMCMELGQSIDIAARKEPADRVAYDIGNALYFLHENGYIHRDVKPDNILRVGGTYKLSDFGLCCKGQCDSVMTNYVITRTYRPPELLFCEGGDYKYDARVDMYSFGVTIWEVQHGKQLFYGSKENIKKQMERFSSRGFYERLITGYENRFTSKEFMRHHNIQPPQGVVGNLRRRDKRVEMFSRHMRRGDILAAYESIGGDLKTTMNNLI